jgi:hypothetical protein
VRLVLTLVLAFATLAAPAHALEIFSEVDANGDPVVYATQPVSWRACVATDCRTFEGDIWHAGESPPGTVFTAYAGTDGASLSGWGGRIAATAPPALGGTPVVGGYVWPLAATWSGGWGGELDDLRVEACKDGACRTLSAPDWVFGHQDLVKLGPELAGWSLHVADRRRNPSEFRPQVVITDPGEVPPLAAGPLVAASPEVPVTTVTAPDPKPFDPGPLAILRKRAMHSKHGLLVGSVACPQTCSITLRVSDGRHTFTRALHGHGIIPLRLARSAKPRRGTLRVKVTINGRAATSGRLKL